MISLMPEVVAVAVIGVPDDIWGEAVHTCVVPKESKAEEHDPTGASSHL